MNPSTLKPRRPALRPTPSPTLGRAVPPTILTDSAIRLGVTGLEAEDEPGDAAGFSEMPGIEDDGPIRLGLPREFEHAETPGATAGIEYVPLEEIPPGDECRCKGKAGAAPRDGRRWEVGDWAQVRWDADPDSDDLEYEVGGRTIRLAPGFTFRVAGVPGHPLPDGEQLYVAFRMPRSFEGRSGGEPGHLCDISADFIEPGGDPAEDAGPIPSPLPLPMPTPPPIAGRRPAVPSDVVIPSVDYAAMIARLDTLRGEAETGMMRAVAVGLKEVIEIARGKAVAS
jgi:hypothetical protein